MFFSALSKVLDDTSQKGSGAEAAKLTPAPVPAKF